MFIKEIKEYNVDSQEADILISDGINSILCYAYPFVNEKNVKFALNGFMAKDIMKSETDEFFIEKNNESYYSYNFKGKIFDNVGRKTIVSVNDIKIELDDYIPKDLNKNDFIEFSVLRVDLITKK